MRLLSVRNLRKYINQMGSNLEKKTNGIKFWKIYQPMGYNFVLLVNLTALALCKIALHIIHSELLGVSSCNNFITIRPLLSLFITPFKHDLIKISRVENVKNVP